MIRQQWAYYKEEERLNYKRINTVTEDSRVCYQAFDGEKQAAEFSWHLESGEGSGIVFWIDEIRLKGEYEDEQTMDLVLQFIQYKCWVSGCGAMHVRIYMKNLFYQDLYRKYGFYTIAQEEVSSRAGDRRIVLKYVLPDSREAHFQSYIRRKR